MIRGHHSFDAVFVHQAIAFESGRVVHDSIDSVDRCFSFGILLGPGR